MMTRQDQKKALKSVSTASEIEFNLKLRSLYEANNVTESQRLLLFSCMQATKRCNYYVCTLSFVHVIQRLELTMKRKSCSLWLFWIVITMPSTGDVPISLMHKHGLLIQSLNIAHQFFRVPLFPKD